MLADIPIAGTEEISSTGVGAGVDIFVVEVADVEGRTDGRADAEEEGDESGLGIAWGPGPITCH